MKTQRDKLQQYQKKIAIVAARETDIARECLRQGDKKKALVALRRKKYQETLLGNTDKHLEQLEMLVNDVEFARVQKDVLYGLQQGTSVLKMMQKEMGGVEGVERLLGGSEEARAYTKVRLRIKWRRLHRKQADEAVVGGERDAGRSNVQHRRGRGRRRAGGVGTTGPWRQGAAAETGARITERADGRVAREGEAEGEMGEESEGTGGGVVSCLREDWDGETLVA
jgi:hypothetical protein